MCKSKIEQVKLDPLCLACIARMKQHVKDNKWDRSEVAMDCLAYKDESHKFLRAYEHDYGHCDLMDSLLGEIFDPYKLKAVERKYLEE